MTKAVKELLEKAKTLYEQIGDEDLQDAIEAVEAIEDAKGTMQEVKELKEMVDEITDKNSELLKKEAEEKAKKEAEEKPKKLNYKGIKQIGSLWYHADDNYQTPFATADECAKHFNN